MPCKSGKEPEHDREIDLILSAAEIEAIQRAQMILDESLKPRQKPVLLCWIQCCQLLSQRYVISKLGAQGRMAGVELQLIPAMTVVDSLYTVVNRIARGFQPDPEPIAAY